MGRARTASVDEPPISGRVLAAQRHQILEHLERTSSAWSVWRWVPAAAAAALLAVAVYRYQPSKAPVSAPAVVINAESDAELFTDVYSMERDVEPRAAAPIRSLFQETAFEKEGQ
jgi:anti-sigma-K factor RskA